MTSIHYPGTEPIRLKFSSLNPTQTSIFDAGPPSPPIVFRSLRSSRSFFTTSSFQASNGTADWTDLDNVLGLHVLGEIDPDAESTVLHGPASTESTTSSSPAAASSMAPPLYVVFTEPNRARWLRRRKTYIARGSGGQLVATIRWPSTKAGKVIGSGAELSRGVGGSVKLESWRKWARERWRGIRKPEDDRAVVVQDTRGRRYVWMLTETAPEDTTDDDFKLKLIPADQSLPHIRDEDSMAVLEFTDGLESPPASSIHPRKPRLDHALLTLRVHDQSGSRLQELLDLAVISVIFALTRCSYRLCMQEYIPPPEPPPIPRLGTPRLLSPLDLRGISSFGLPTHPSIPDVESQLPS